jgi:ligand-binding sensor domain-containing protein
MKTFLQTLIFFLLAMQISFAQWVQTNGPYGGSVWSLAGDETKLVAGTQDNGIFLSTNFGNDWLEVNSGLPIDSRVPSIAISGTNIFAAAGDLFLSTNFGIDWSKVSSGLPTNLDVNSIAIKDTNIFLRAFSNGSNGIFLSTNNGSSWTAINCGFTNYDISSIAFLGTCLFVGTGEGIFVTTDSGNKWTAVNSELSSVNYLAVSGENIYAAGDGLFVSTNYAKSWTNLNLSVPPWSFVSCIAVKDTNIFAGLHGVLGGPGQGILLSTNNGESWTSVNKGLTNGNINSFVSVGTEIFVATDGGVFCSTNYGANWNAVNNGLMNSNIFSLFVNKSNLYAGTFDNGLILSTDDGLNWKEINSGLPTNNFIRELIVRESELFLVTSYGIFHSLDNGDNWIDISSDLNNVVTLTISPDGKNMFAGTYGQGVFFSSDNEVKWTEINSGLTNLNVLKLYIDSNTRNLLAGTAGGVFRSTNNGESWTSSGLMPYVENIDAISNNLFVSSSNGIFCSTDSGSNWKLISSVLPDLGGPYNIATDGSNLFAGHYYPGVFLSTNNGTSWENVNKGFSLYPNSIAVYPHITCLAVGTTNAFVGTSRGVWKRPLSEMITDVKSTTDLPKEFALYQNYPNPFNPSTTFRYSIPNESKVIIKVYDILGKEIEALVSEEKPAGTYELIWNAANLPSGVYFYQLRAGNLVETKKMLLLK